MIPRTISAVRTMISQLYSSCKINLTTLILYRNRVNIVMFSKFMCISATIFVFFGLTGQTFSASMDSFPAKIALISEHTSIAKNTKIVWIGIHQKLESGWHTYWRYPGDAGIPVKVKWTRNSNAVVGPIKWPLPEIMRTGPLVSYGYKKEVLLLIPLKVRKYYPIELQANIEWLVCREICISRQSSVGINIPIGDGEKDEVYTSLFQRTKLSVPSKLPWELIAYQERGQFIIKIMMKKDYLKSIQSAVFLPGLDGLIENSKPQEWSKIFLGVKSYLKLKMMAGYGLNDGLDKFTGTLVIEKNGNRKFRREGFDIQYVRSRNQVTAE